MRTLSSVRQLTGSTLVACLAVATVTLAQAPLAISGVEREVTRALTTTHSGAMPTTAPAS